jgi:hypothetical protein
LICSDHGPVLFFYRFDPKRTWQIKVNSQTQFSVSKLYIKQKITCQCAIIQDLKLVSKSLVPHCRSRNKEIRYVSVRYDWSGKLALVVTWGGTNARLRCTGFWNVFIQKRNLAS